MEKKPSISQPQSETVISRVAEVKMSFLQQSHWIFCDNNQLFIIRQNHPSFDPELAARSVPNVKIFFYFSFNVNQLEHACMCEIHISAALVVLQLPDTYSSGVCFSCGTSKILSWSICWPSYCPYISNNILSIMTSVWRQCATLKFLIC